MKKMKKILAVLAVVGSAGAAAQADVVLNVDVSTPNQVTISATTAASAVTVSGGNTTGFYLANFFNGTGTLTGNTLVAGATLSTFNDPADGSPVLFRGGGTTDPGLNIWSFSTNSTVTFTAGTQAFAGSATWNLTPAQFAFFTGGPASGDIYFAADDVTDLPNAQIVGQYRVIPAPGALALLGLGGLAAARRRRA